MDPNLENLILLLPEKIGTLTALAIMFVAIWIYVGQFTLSDSIIGIILSVIGIVLTIVIFIFQLNLSEQQHKILKKSADYEQMQKWYIRQYILERLRWLLEEFEQIEDQIKEWKNEASNPAMQSVREKSVVENNNRINKYMDELMGPSNFANPLFPESVKQNLRVIKDLFDKGPTFIKPDKVLSQNFERAKFVIQATEQVVIARKGPFG